MSRELDRATPNPLRGSDWGRLLEDEFSDPYWERLMAFVGDERARHVVYPQEDEVFRALEFTGCEQTNVVIVGQDPYPGPGQAHGLSFSVPRGVPPPGALRNILKELASECGSGRSGQGDLAPWAHRGVMLLNAVLTVRAGEIGSHQGKGWERFTDAVIRVVTERRNPVFLLWGEKAQRKEATIRRVSGSSARIIKSSHPSPRAARRPCLGSPPFMGSRPFSRTNELLRRAGQREIDWCLV